MLALTPPRDCAIPVLWQNFIREFNVPGRLDTVDTLRPLTLSGLCAIPATNTHAITRRGKVWPPAPGLEPGSHHRHQRRIPALISTRPRRGLSKTRPRNLGSEVKTSDLAAHFSRNSGAANTFLLTIQTFNEHSRMAKLSQLYLRSHKR